MNLHGYELLSQLDAGKDGVSYAARDLETGADAELFDLTRCRTNPRRWTRVTDHLRKVALLTHRCARKLTKLHLEDERPIAAFCSREPQTLEVTLRGEIDPTVAASIATGLASLLAESHRLGMAHGHFVPSQIHLTADGQPVVGFTRSIATRSNFRESPFDPPCIPPSVAGAAAFDPMAADVYGLGAITAMLYRSSGQRDFDPQTEQVSLPESAPPRLTELLKALLSEDPFDRPLAQDAYRELADILEVSAEGPPTEDGGERTTELSLGPVLGEAPPAATQLVSRRLGRFELQQLLGSGATGAVYRAIDTANGAAVAVKVLHPRHAASPTVMQRFRREARILASIENSHVAKLIDANFEEGLLYLAMEHVDGVSLGKLLSDRDHLSEGEAIAVLSDVARALVEPHERGLVHRDIKPDNILVQIEEGDSKQPANSAAPLRAVLVDFGIARDLLSPEEADVTLTGSIVGTPSYMSPEQGLGEPIGPEADIYSMGATLFHTLTGRPPFEGQDAWQVIRQHRYSDPPDVSEIQDGVSTDLCGLVTQSLSKSSTQRPTNAAMLLEELLRISHGPAVVLEQHPRQPASERGTLEYDFNWDLESAPDVLWPFVSNTERLNEAIGLPAVSYSREVDDLGQIEQRAELHRLGMRFEWQEHPFEWIEGRRLSVLREFEKGPFKWLINIVELIPRSEGGTRLRHRVLVEPRSVLGKAAAGIEVGVKARRALEQVYQRIDRSVAANDGEDSFRSPTRLRTMQRKRLSRSLAAMERQGADREICERLADYLSTAPSQEVARIRPLVLADRWGMKPQQVLETCLLAAQEGLLILLWDVICPRCRTPADIKDTLRELEAHGECPACNLDFEHDFASSIELIFRISRQIRTADLGTYCIGGPGHLPHVIAQVRVAPGECFSLELTLERGTFRLLSLPSSLDIPFETDIPGKQVHWEVDVSGQEGTSTELSAGQQHLLLRNSGPSEQLVRIERCLPRRHVLTAAKATGMSLFRKLFPDEILAPDQMIGVSAVTLLRTALARAPSDIETAALARKYFELAKPAIEENSGSLLGSDRAHLRAAFEDPASAVRATKAMLDAAGRELPATTLRAALHHGRVAALTANGELDYVGETTEIVDAQFVTTNPGELTMSEAVASDPAVATMLPEFGVCEGISALDTPRQIIFHRFRI